MRTLLLSLFLLAGASPAFACINDRRVDREEQEFRSRYKADEVQATAPDRDRDLFATLFPVAGAGIGGLLLVGAVRRALRGS